MNERRVLGVAYFDDDRIACPIYSIEMVDGGFVAHGEIPGPWPTFNGQPFRVVGADGSLVFQTGEDAPPEWQEGCAKDDAVLHMAVTCKPTSPFDPRLPDGTPVAPRRVW